MLDLLPEPLCDFSDSTCQEKLFEADQLRARYQSDRAAGHILANSYEAIRVEVTYHSNAIEGSTLTLRDTQLVIEGREPNSGKSLREIYEARNHDRAIRMIEDWVASHSGPSALTESHVLSIHREVMADIDRVMAGVFRTDRVLISGSRFVPPGSHKFPVLIPAFLNLAGRGGLHPIVQAAELHYNFVAIHPFGDGNGRTGRLLMNYHLLKSGYPLTIIPVEHRSRYLSALESANDGNTLPFIDFIIQCVCDSTIRLIGE